MVKRSILVYRVNDVFDVNHLIKHLILHFLSHFSIKLQWLTFVESLNSL